MKKCAKCNLEKIRSEFTTRGNGGIYSYCKQCCREQDRARRQTKEHIEEMNRRKKERMRQKEYNLANPPISQKCTTCNQIKPIVEFASDRSKKYGKDSRCKICMRKRDNKRNAQPGVRAKRNEVGRKYHSSPRGLAKARKRSKERYAHNPAYAISCRISAVMNECLRDTPKRKQGRKWETLVGYTLEELMAHLESKFLPGMSWKNRSKWHIDHIIPRNAFDITSAECDEFKKCWELNNLQPLWAKDNIIKKDSLPPIIPQNI